MPGLSGSTPTPLVMVWRCLPTRLMDVHGLAVRVGERDGRTERHLEKESYQLITNSVSNPSSPWVDWLLVVSGLTCSPLRRSPSFYPLLSVTTTPHVTRLFCFRSLSNAFASACSPNPGKGTPVSS